MAPETTDTTLRALTKTAARASFVPNTGQRGEMGYSCLSSRITQRGVRQWFQRRVSGLRGHSHGTPPAR
jgi:hypothetical protein